MRLIIFLLFLLVSCMVIPSCNSITQKKFEFFYYPASNVYYDVTNSVYLYSLDGGKTWDSLNTKTNKEPAIPGGKQVIYSTTPEIWEENAEHLKQYNGHVMNITGNDSNTSNETLVAERKTKKAKAPVTNTNEKPEKKPGFFKRLFGKKN